MKLDSTSDRYTDKMGSSFNINYEFIVIVEQAESCVSYGWYQISLDRN